MEPYLDAVGPEEPWSPWLPYYRPQARPKAAYAGMISRLDRDVGRVLEKLEELGLDSRTLVFFSSDNGRAIEGGTPAEFFGAGSPHRGHKRELYEGGIRAPLLARWPGRIAPGSETDLLSGFQDLMPTVNELVGVRAHLPLDGRSLLPTLLGEPERQVPHDFLYWEFDEWGGKQAIRRGRWKLIRQPQHCTPILFGGLRGCVGMGVELYDLESDVGETRNLAEAHPERVSELIATMERARRPSPDFPIPFD